MHKNATKCNKTLSKWCKNKHGASKIIDTFGTYQCVGVVAMVAVVLPVAHANPRTIGDVGRGRLLSGVDVDDRPVGNPKRRCDEHSSKFSLIKKLRFIESVGKIQTSEGDAC
jgi:hypothetical protein